MLSNNFDTKVVIVYKQPIIQHNNRPTCVVKNVILTKIISLYMTQKLKLM